MLLSVLLKSIDCELFTEDVEIGFITDNSEKCKENSIFVCHKGAEKFVESAISNGAIAVVSAEKITESCYIAEDTRKAYSKLCAEFFGNSHKKLKLIGVTGTNGKTTVSSMLYHILTMSGRKCALLGTTGYLHCNENEEATLTTPDPFIMHRMFYEMTECGT